MLRWLRFVKLLVVDAGCKELGSVRWSGVTLVLAAGAAGVSARIHEARRPRKSKVVIAHLR